MMGVSILVSLRPTAVLIVLQAFEQLVAARIFVPAGGQSAGLGREFLKYRCVPEREDVKSAVDKMGKTNLKKWFTKAL